MGTFVRREAIEGLRLQADMNGEGPAEVFRTLESRPLSLRGCHFNGTRWVGR